MHTYGDLRTSAARLARRLDDAGVAPGAPVALLAANGAYWIAAYLAVLASGRVAVPMPTTVPAAEAAARAAWARCPAVLLGRTQTARRGVFAAHGIRPICEDDVSEEGGRDELSYAPVGRDDDAAYLFTSGTTGTPRAVRLTHGNIQANTTSIIDYLPLHADDRMLVLLPFTYVFGASLLHTHLRVGASLIGHASAAYPETTVRALADERCTGLAGVPSVYNALVRNSSFCSAALPALRTVQQAGGSLSAAVRAELMAAHPGAKLFVMYGQTEATARLSFLPPAELDRRPGSIGRGIPGVELRVVAPDGSSVAPGAVGEIWATGDNVSPGYLHDAAASRAKMPSGVLHTGDLATVDADGFIYIVDRAEDIIKSWGHRVASAEVEAAVMELAEVVAAAAVGVPDETAGERIEVAVVLRAGATLEQRAVIEHCRARLSPVMTPVRVHVVDALPLNANGKVVKREVRELCVRASAPQPVGERA